MTPAGQLYNQNESLGVTRRRTSARRLIKPLNTRAIDCVSTATTLGSLKFSWFSVHACICGGERIYARGFSVDVISENASNAFDFALPSQVQRTSDGSDARKLAWDRKITPNSLPPRPRPDWTTAITEFRSTAKLSFFPPLFAAAAHCTPYLRLHSDTGHRLKPYAAHPHNSDLHTINTDHTADPAIVKHLTHLMPLNSALYS